MTSQAANKQLKDTLLNISMKFGQVIKYNMRKIFLEKLYTKCGGETIPRPFSKKSKLSTSLGQQFKVLLHGKFRAIQTY